MSQYYKINITVVVMCTTSPQIVTLFETIKEFIIIPRVGDLIDCGGEDGLLLTEVMLYSKDNDADYVASVSGANIHFDDAEEATTFVDELLEQGFKPI